MIVIYVAVKTKDNVTDEFERILRAIQADASRLAGCVKYEWFHRPDSAQQYVVYGEFDTHTNFENYLNSPIVKRIGDELMPLLDAPPQFSHYDATLLEGS